MIDLLLVLTRNYKGHCFVEMMGGLLSLRAIKCLPFNSKFTTIGDSFRIFELGKTLQ
jgi:hypothetical protein